MVANGTVDEKILTKADLKTEVNSALLDGGGTPAKGPAGSGSAQGDARGHGFSSVSAILADALRTHLN